MAETKLSRLAFQDAWVEYTPVWTGSVSNPAIGNGTLTGHYIQFGKTVHFRIVMTAGSTTTFGSGDFRFTLPVTVKSTIAQYLPAGGCTLVDSGSGIVDGTTVLAGSSPITYVVGVVYDPNLYLSRVVGGTATPFTWVNGDQMHMSGTYEAA